MRHVSGNRLPRAHLGALHLEYLLPWLALLASLAVAQQLWRGAQESAQRDLWVRFDFRVRELAGDVEHRMSAYEHVLAGVQGLFAASRRVDREEFRAYVAALDLARNYPGIQGVGFAQAVPAQQKTSHLAAVRRDGFPAYAVRPEGQRDAYAPLVYIEPFDGPNLNAFGYDIYSEPIRRAAMDAARDSDRAAITGKIRLSVETGPHAQAGFQMLLPVYQTNARHDGLASRRANLLGWIVGLFRMDDLMAGIFGVHAAELGVEIYDGDSWRTPRCCTAAPTWAGAAMPLACTASGTWKSPDIPGRSRCIPREISKAPMTRTSRPSSPLPASASACPWRCSFGSPCIGNSRRRWRSVMPRPYAPPSTAIWWRTAEAGSSRPTRPWRT